jgi:hypothetical protein
MSKVSKLSKKTKHEKSSKRSKRSKRSTVSKSVKMCRSKLSNKIKINIKEMKSGSKRIKSIPQAIAIAYSQIRKKHPKCSKFLKKKN